MDLLARAKQLESEGRSIVHLEVGEPDFATARPIVDAGIQALRQLKTHYTAATGLPELRQAIAGHYQRKFGLVIDPRRIVVTPGASGALQLALSVLTDVGDNILLTDPGYPCNRNIAKVLGIDSIDVAVTADTQYQFSAEHIKQHWSEKTRAAIVASPSNPTGTLIERDVMKALVKAVADAGGALIVDEIYQGLVYDVEEYTALSLSDDVFVVNSFSKYFGMTGWRLGWMVVPENYIDAVDRVAQNIFLAPPTISQHAALAAFESATDEILQRRVAIFKERRDYLLPVLNEIGFKVSAQPQGAFYVYADCSGITDDSFQWTKDLLEKEGVAVTPGIDFGEFEASTHVRFSYTRSIEELKRAMCRITRFIK
ncbi:MAG: aminotransferase class I/II-fold pyridoxal phosphate-dependent enzyme [Gammaproteobacteria bacterium]|nr:aminotransferase class I/II-fold pyridoxal phosphate-dependent enzyme [Gammaproteobacteria bacterium]MCK5262565.1 aminotransferase class I/II-fold pyridoxal phosphate-dependent enzyme [Gammaproteobacteria bacterium]